jgi:hypothetical protein
LKIESLFFEIQLPKHPLALLNRGFYPLQFGLDWLYNSDIVPMPLHQGLINKTIIVVETHPL